MPFRVEFIASAAKEFRSLPPETKQRVRQGIDRLSENARPSGVRKLQGHESLYRIRVGSYRVVYQIEEEAQLIRITRIRHRREVYR